MSQKSYDTESIRQACNKLLEDAENEIHQLKVENDRLNTEIGKQASDSSQLVRRLEDEKAQVTDQLRQSVTNADSAITACQKLESEVSQLKQQLNDSRNNYRDFVAWGEVQPMLNRIRDFISAGNTTWGDLQALENRHMRKQLPGDGVIQETWSNSNVPFGMLDPSVLSSFPVTNNFGMNTSQVPPLPGQYPDLS
jgi:chromosome segregation ATPase